MHSQIISTACSMKFEECMFTQQYNIDVLVLFHVRHCTHSVVM